MTFDEIQVLKRVPLFKDLTDDELAKIISIVVTRKYKKSQLVFHEGDLGEAVFFIKTGRVKIYKTSADGREQILHFFKDGDVFAEVVLFEGGNYPATVEVLEDSEIGMIKNKDLDNLLKINGEIAVHLLKLLSRRLREAQTLVRDLALKDTYSRSCGLIWKLACQQGIRISNGIKVELDLSRQDLASMIGTSRETFTRALSDLQKQKIIVLDKDGFIVINEKKLQDCF